MTLARGASYIAVASKFSSKSTKHSVPILGCVDICKGRIFPPLVRSVASSPAFSVVSGLGEFDAKNAVGFVFEG